jgi:hypothetical protein
MFKQVSEALPFLRDYVSQAPNGRSGHVWLAATHELGQLIAHPLLKEQQTRT